MTWRQPEPAFLHNTSTNKHNEIKRNPKKTIIFSETLHNRRLGDDGVHGVRLDGALVNSLFHDPVAGHTKASAPLVAHVPNWSAGDATVTDDDDGVVDFLGARSAEVSTPGEVDIKDAIFVQITAFASAIRFNVCYLALVQSDQSLLASMATETGP